MEETTVTVQARIDPALAAEFEAVVKREERTKQAVVERALRAYIANSKAEVATRLALDSVPEAA